MNPVVQNSGPRLVASFNHSCLFWRGGPNYSEVWIREHKTSEKVLLEVSELI